MEESSIYADFFKSIIQCKIKCPDLTLEDKMKAIEYSKEADVRPAAKKFPCDPKSIRNWVTKEIKRAPNKRVKRTLHPGQEFKNIFSKPNSFYSVLEYFFL